MDKPDRYSQSIEDYLKAIYDLTQDEATTTTNQVAARLAVAPASVTSMLKKLAAHEPPLVDYTRHHGVSLSPGGREAALRIIRRHRLLEQFLLEVLGYSWDEIHEEAEHLEHTISPKFEQRLAERLGQPDFDPHGDPIPRSDLSLPPVQSIQINQLKPGQSATVRRVRSSDPGLLRYLGEHGIRPDVEIKMVKQVPYDRTLHIRVSGEAGEQVLGGDLGPLIMVELQPKTGK